MQLDPGKYILFGTSIHYTMKMFYTFTVVGSVCVCVSVKSHLTSGASVRPENTVTYSAGNGGQKICGVFSDTAPLQRSSTPSIEGHMYSWPFS